MRSHTKRISCWLFVSFSRIDTICSGSSNKWSDDKQRIRLNISDARACSILENGELLTLGGRRQRNEFKRITPPLRERQRKPSNRQRIKTNFNCFWLNVSSIALPRTNVNNMISWKSTTTRWFGQLNGPSHSWVSHLIIHRRANKERTASFEFPIWNDKETDNTRCSLESSRLNLKRRDIARKRICT